jgi:dTDP-4-dehydrorhamnose 3,5-epimerase
VKIIDTGIADVKIIEPAVFADDRGYFLETWNAAALARCGLNWQFVQDNQSRSHRNVLRGLHYQIQNTQGKLVRVSAGAVLDVAVDLRRSSPTFGRWVGVELSAENHRMLWIPPGFAHGFLSLKDNTDLAYKCTDVYAPQYDRTLLWNDPDIGIDWPLPPGEEPLVAPKDKAGQLLKSADIFA